MTLIQALRHVCFRITFVWTAFVVLHLFETACRCAFT